MTQPPQFGVPGHPAETSRPRGFSLVEVAMALGIFAFAMMGLIGLLPTAVNTHRDAKEDTILAQIKQRLAAEVVFTEGARLAELHNFSRSFDAEGRELLPSEESRAVYRGRITLESFRAPGATSDSQTLQRAVIRAVYDPTPNSAIINDSNTPASASILVTRAESAPVAMN